jgi:RNA recognition motif-containing protein
VFFWVGNACFLCQLDLESEREKISAVAVEFHFPSSPALKNPNSKFKHTRKHTNTQNVPQACKLFIGGIPDGTTVEALGEYASKFGALSDVAIMSGRGFAFVTFADPRHAQAFLEVRKKKQIESRENVRKRADGSGREREGDAGNELALNLFLARRECSFPSSFAP